MPDEMNDTAAELKRARDAINQQQMQIGQLMTQNGQLVIERAQMSQRIDALTEAAEKAGNGTAEAKT